MSQDCLHITWEFPQLFWLRTLHHSFYERASDHLVLKKPLTDQMQEIAIVVPQHVTLTLARQWLHDYAVNIIC